MKNFTSEDWETLKVICTIVFTSIVVTIFISKTADYIQKKYFPSEKKVR